VDNGLNVQNPEVTAKHAAKVYGKASVGAPPICSHIDSRMINGETVVIWPLLVFNSVLKMVLIGFTIIYNYR
jgi:L-2-hydroxyglutarate oxidase LhgO